MKHLPFILIAILLSLFPAAAMAAPPAVHTPPALVRNLAVDYGANPHMPSDQLSALLQKAVDDVGRAGGGTVIIPADSSHWNLDRPIFVGYPDVTIAGQGTGTAVEGRGILLGMKEQYAQPITAAHFPPISPGRGVFDASVTGPKFGLRTTDGTTAASGFFPNDWLTYGGEIKHTDPDDYWTDYAKAVGSPIYWQSPQYTFNLILKNNGTSPIKGTLCGVGPGGQTAQSTTGAITDPLNVWTIESKGRTGADLAFKFHRLDAQGKLHLETLPISHQPVGQGVLRIAVQLDFATGTCRSWASLSTGNAVPLSLAGKLELGAGSHLMPLQYGAFRLGAVTDNPFSGSPARSGADGDWTYCGYSLFNTLLYSTAAPNDRAGAPIKKTADNTTTPTDSETYFPQRADHCIGFLPMEGQPSSVLLRYHDGYGYWLPRRPLEPIAGTLTVRDLSFGGGPDLFVVGEANHVLIRGVYQPSGAIRAVGSWDCNPINNLVEVHNCTLMGRDASFYGKSENLRIGNVDGGGGQAFFRLVGCQGEITYVLVTAFVAADNYFTLNSGPYGGPLKITYFCIDNEGLSWIPRKAAFHLEPSLNPGPGGNLVTFHGGIYTGTMPKGASLVELADPPGTPPAKVRGRVSIDYVDFGSSAANPPDSLIRCLSRRWTGDLLNTDADWATASGLLHYDGVPDTGSLHTYSYDLSAFPTKGTWYAGSHFIQIPNATGSGYTRYRCTQTGVYGTGQEPQWQAVK